MTWCPVSVCNGETSRGHSHKFTTPVVFFLPQSLQVLDLSRAWLSWKSTGELLSHLRALPALREMYLQGCEVSQTAVEYLMETEVSAETPGSPFVQFSRQCEGLCVQVPDVHGRD